MKERDPSDGTTYEISKPEIKSGLPISKNVNAEEIARLEKSREWLKNWRKRNEAQGSSEASGDDLGIED